VGVWGRLAVKETPKVWVQRVKNYATPTCTLRFEHKEEPVCFIRYAALASIIPNSPFSRLFSVILVSK
jgi:hypothetical protein